MAVERIYVRQSSGTSQTELGLVQVMAGSGIVGDRYFGCDDEPGQNITLVEAEEIESSVRTCCRQVPSLAAQGSPMSPDPEHFL